MGRSTTITKGRAIKERAMPLADFDPEHRARIEEQVASPNPPPKWLDFGMAQGMSRAWFEWHWVRDMYPTGDEVRPSIRRQLRDQVIARDGFTCGLCGGAVEPDDVHIDHIHPRSLGGPDELDNLQVAHALCNMRKGNRI